MTAPAPSWVVTLDGDLHVKAGADLWRVEVSWTLAQALIEVLRRMGAE